MIQLRWLFIFCTHYFSKWISFERISDQASASTVLRRLPFYLYRDIIGCKKWKGVCMKKKPIYLYILLFFSTVGTLTSAVSTFGASKSFELTDDFAKQLGLTTAQDKSDYVTYYEKSAQLNQSPLTFLFVSLILIALLATFYFLFMKQDLLTAHYTYMGQILLSQAFSCYNYFAGRPLLASFSNPSLRQRYLASSSIALLLLTALSLLFLGIVLYKTLRLRKAQAA